MQPCVTLTLLTHYATMCCYDSTLLTMVYSLLAGGVGAAGAAALPCERAREHCLRHAGVPAARCRGGGQARQLPRLHHQAAPRLRDGPRQRRPNPSPDPSPSPSPSPSPDLTSTPHQVLGQNGASLSGGQKQRVAIARALIRDPAVLLLDEATSALDPESARLVEAALRDASRDRSVVLTTHKLSQARLADRIVVMQHGAIAEEGSHAELVAKRGLYYEMLNTGTGDDDDELT